MRIAEIDVPFSNRLQGFGASRGRGAKEGEHRGGAGDRHHLHGTCHVLGPAFEQASATPCRKIRVTNELSGQAARCMGIPFYHHGAKQ
jgi:hypothetical protein